MHKFFQILVIMGMLLAAPFSRAATEAGMGNAQFNLNTSSPEASRKYRLGDRVTKQMTHDQTCVYDFSVLGGAVGSVNLRDHERLGQSCVIPKNAIIQHVLIDVLTPGTTSASGTMALTAQSAGDLKAALAAASYTGVVAGIPVDTAATAIKLTADRTIVGTIATGALTAGKWNVHIRYVMSQ